MRLSRRLSTAASTREGPAESSAAATSPETDSRAQSRNAPSLCPCAFCPPALRPILYGSKGYIHAMLAPQGPARGALGHAIVTHQAPRQLDHPMGVGPPGRSSWRGAWRSEEHTSEL